MEDIQAIKQRFEIIGNNPGLNRAIDIATQVAPTDLSVLITGESGVGKEIFPRIIHAYSTRKHAQYIAVNCGAIPEGTIDSELFGHEKGAFTGAVSDRKGYFEVTDGGTIFLDEVGELPLPTQARLLRVLETGEFIRVGSSKVQKTNVRVIAATNLDIPQAVKNGKFREDLYYRLNAIPITIPPLRERKEDIPLLFRKFAADFAEKYRMPAVRLTEEAVKILFDMKKDMNDLKRLVYDLMQNEPQRETGTTEPTTSLVLRNLYDHEPGQFTPSPSPTLLNHREDHIQDTEAVIEESFSIEEKEKELITKALEKNHGKRKLAAKDLGISERTLYRKLKEYNLEN